MTDEELLQRYAMGQSEGMTELYLRLLDVNYLGRLASISLAG